MAEQRNRIGRVNADAVTFGERSPIHASPAEPTPARPRKAGKGRRVFVIHGRDLAARDALFDCLRALGLTPMEWERLVRNTDSTVPSLKEVINKAVRDASAVIALLTPDDIVELHPTLRGATDSADEHGSCQARPNVFLELGMALALHPDRTIILEVGTMRRPTDLAGLNYVHMDASGNWLNKMASRLEGAGCPVDRTGDDWRTLDRFNTLAAHERKPR
ncbi:hypothetical protein C6361_00880 [Plantactinospora sp. BC1]|uniref:TIR domain-containing protein n=1 Tax=Plantactinospora sp. BC1 TaxID=2108470 RepID=UPI000D1567B4|nr:nucleotide-binding protein [Plantactinospora sp. BC1]AVT28289.1 hypothetical protein C6361_00880 [Plantactinospora sp. BC1]